MMHTSSPPPVSKTLIRDFFITLKVVNYSNFIAAMLLKEECTCSFVGLIMKQNKLKHLRI